MSDQAPPAEQSLAAARAAPDNLPEWGRPQIHGINTIGLWSLYLKEVRRFFKVQTQTFESFLAPGLIVMAMMQNSFANSSFSFLSGKIQGTIIDLLMPPLSHGELLAGIVGAAVTRAVLVGCAVALAVFIYPGAKLILSHAWAIVWFGLMGALMLGFFGLMASIWAEKFDHNAAVTNFVVAPLSLLSGTFYTLDRLHEPFYTISHFNPFFYVISGFRYGFIGQTDIGGGTPGDVLMAAGGLLALNAVLALATFALLRSGWKIRQ